MKTFIFGENNTLGDKILLDKIKKTFSNVIYMGKKVDISKIPIEDQNLIVILSGGLYSLNFDLVDKFIKKDTTKPVIVVKKIKTFGAVFFKENYEVDKITPNKVYVFSGFLYLPKKYIKKQKTISNILRTVSVKEWRSFVVNSKLLKK